jgi:hypothetical protein
LHTGPKNVEDQFHILIGNALPLAGLAVLDLTVKHAHQERGRRVSIRQSLQFIVLNRLSQQIIQRKQYGVEQLCVLGVQTGFYKALLLAWRLPPDQEDRRTEVGRDPGVFS